MKVVYRILILIAVFFGSLYFFSSNISEGVSSEEIKTIEMGAATFPIVTLMVGGEEINLLHGYASNLDEMIMRESVTPLGGDRTFKILIDENESIIKKLKYEIIDESGEELESNSVIVLSEEKRPSIEVQVREPMKIGREYIAKITLITDQSKRIYYYTRLKLYDKPLLTEKLDFVRKFHKSVFEKNMTEEIKSYLEPKPNADRSNFAKVDINSSIDMIAWGDLKPDLIYAEVPSITEFYDGTTSVVLSFIVSAQTDSGLEHYAVKEKYRFNYTDKRVNLYNFERQMETLYDVNMTSLGKSELKLGITNRPEVPTMTNTGNTLIAFVYGRELMLYRTDINELVKVFTFYKDEDTQIRDLYDQHEIQLLSVSEEGVVDFLVYGYLNRGEYEGRVGIVLYRYYLAEERVEEQAYIPVNQSFQQLREQWTGFAYRNARDEFLFSIFDSIYSYNFVTKALTVLASGVPKENLFYSETGGYAAWQDNADNSKATSIKILSLEDGKETLLKAPEGQTIRLFGHIEKNIIYGYCKKVDVAVSPDGSKVLPAYQLFICDSTGYVLKSYEKQGYYINGVKVQNNVVVMERLKQREGSRLAYTAAADDHILNQAEEEIKSLPVVTRVTKLTLTEYYLTLPEGVAVKSTPDVAYTNTTIIGDDKTLRVSEQDKKAIVYYAYSFGDIVYTSKKAGDVIRLADTLVGTVINKDGRVTWERGVKTPKSAISDLVPVYTDPSHNSVQAAMKMLLLYKNMDVDTAAYDSNEIPLDQWLSQYLKAVPVDLTGITLDEALYYVYKQRPVIAFKPDGQAVVITGYDPLGVTLFEPSGQRTSTYTMKDAVTLFEEAGNRFYSYIE